MIATNQHLTSLPSVLSRRLIAFCDILGFSRRLQTQSIEDLHRTYSRLMDHAMTFIFQQDDGNEPDHRNFARAEFLFDSVLLVSNPLDSDGGPRAVADFMSALSDLFESSLGLQLPIRGAITLGDVFEDASRRMSLSASIPDLLCAEKQQKWAGVRILEPAVDPILDGLYGTNESEVVENGTGHVFRYPVPTKGGHVPSLVLNWVYFCDQKNIDAGLAFLAGDKRDETERFIAVVNARLPPQRVLSESVRPAVSVRMRGYRTGCNIKVIDAQGNGTVPPAGSIISYEMIGILDEPEGEISKPTS